MEPIEIILKILSPKFCKKAIKLLKKHWFRYYLTAIKIITIPIVLYVGSYGIYGIKEYRNYKLEYINREPVRLNRTFDIVKFIESLVVKAGHGVTISWISIETPNTKSFKKHLEFSVVRGCDFNINSDGCLINSKDENPQYYCNEQNEHGCYYELSEKDGIFLEKDKIVFFDENNPVSFKELEPIVIPIYKKGKGLSMEIMALKHRAPKIAKLLSTNPVPINSSTYGVLTKVRDVTFINKNVIYVILVVKRGDNPLSIEGMKQTAYLIARKIKNNILIL